LLKIISCSFILAIPLLLEKAIRDTDLLFNNSNGNNYDENYKDSTKRILLIGIGIGILSILSSFFQ
jgi:hypothetical protein